MQIRNLSKSDYYKSKNIFVPKQLHKLTPQPPVRSHLLQPIATMAIEIRRYIDSKENKEKREIEYIAFEQIIHQLQVKIQDLNKNLGNKEEQINQKIYKIQRDGKRIQNLQKEIFDLQNYLQKMQYQYKTTIQYIKSENRSQKNEHQQRINVLQWEFNRKKEQYEKERKEMKDNFDVKLQSAMTNKQTYKAASQEVLVQIRKEIQQYSRQNKRLKNQIILSENEVFQKINSYQEENFILKEKLQSKQLQFNLLLLKFNNQIQTKNSRINDLNEKIDELRKDFQKKQEKLQNQKKLIQRRKREKEEKWRHQVEILIREKNELEVQNIKAQNEISLIKDLNVIWQKRWSEISTKINFVQLQKERNEENYRQKLKEVQEQFRAKRQNQFIEIKRKYQQNILIIERDTWEKESQIANYRQKIDKQLAQKQTLSNEKRETNQKLKSVEEELKEKRGQMEEKKLEMEKLGKQLLNLTQYVEILQSQHSTQLIFLKQRIITQKNTQTQLIISIKIKQIEQLQSQLAESLHQIQSLQSQYISQINSKSLVIQSLNLQLSKLHHQYSLILNQFHSLNSLFQKQKNDHQSQIYNLKKIIQDQAQAIRKNTQHIEIIKHQYDKAKIQISVKEQQIQKLQNQVKIFKIQSDQIKLLSIRKCSQIQQKSQQVVSNLRIQKSGFQKRINQLQNQIKNVQRINRNNQEMIEQLQKKKEEISVQNQKWRQAYAKKQETANNILQQLHIEKKQVTQKISQDYRQKVAKLQLKNQALFQQTNILKQQNISLNQIQFKNQILIKQLQNKIDQKVNEIQYCNQKLSNEKNEIIKLQEKLIRLDTKILTLDTERKKFQSQNESLQQRLSRYEENMISMKKSNIYQSDLLQDLRSRNNKLLIINEEQRMQIEFQVGQKQKIKGNLKELQREVQITKNELIQMKQFYEKVKLKEQSEEFQLKVKEIKEEYEKKGRQIFQKIIQIESKLNQKDDQLQQAKKIIQQKEEMLEEYEQKQTQYKKTCEELSKFKAEAGQLVAQFQRCSNILGQRDQQINKLQKKIKQIQSKNIFQLKQFSLKCLQSQTNLKILSQQYQNQLKRNQQIKSNYEIQIAKYFKYKEQSQILICEIEELKHKIQIIQRSNDQIRNDIKREYEQILMKYRAQKQQLINSMKQDQEKCTKQLKRQISDLIDQKLKIKNQFQFYKQKNDEELAHYQSEVLVLHQNINKLKRTNEYLFQYKKRWDRISGQVKEYQNLDSKQVIKDVDLSISESMKSSIIIERPYFARFEIKQGPFGQKKEFQEFGQKQQKEDLREKKRNQQFEERRGNQKFSVKKSFLETPQTRHKELEPKKLRYRYEDIDSNE